MKFSLPLLEKKKKIANPLNTELQPERFSTQTLKTSDGMILLRVALPACDDTRSTKRDMYKRCHKNRHKSCNFFHCLSDQNKTKQHKTLPCTLHSPDEQTFLIDLRYKHLNIKYSYITPLESNTTLDHIDHFKKAASCRLLAKLCFLSFFPLVTFFCININTLPHHFNCSE